MRQGCLQHHDVVRMSTCCLLGLRVNGLLLAPLVVLLCLLQLGQTRWLYLMLWMAKHGNGLVPPKNIHTSAKRLRVT